MGSWATAPHHPPTIPPQPASSTLARAARPWPFLLDMSTPARFSTTEMQSVGVVIRADGWVTVEALPPTSTHLRPHRSISAQAERRWTYPLGKNTPAPSLTTVQSHVGVRTTLDNWGTVGRQDSAVLLPLR